jgi:uncharacterized Tic20 family protein
MKTKYVFLKSLALLILILVVPIVGFQLNKAPKAVPENAPLSEFSAARAMKHLVYIASEPHSIGTNAHAKVRDYIIDELRKLGIEPEIQSAELFYPGSLSASASSLAATVENIIVRLPGTEPGKLVLAVGHYDSVRDSYGASDDGSGVVTMLETIRLLQLRKPFKNDIVFLFTDGEEIGLIGAKAFVEKHPLAKNIGIVLNFESSGTTGPSLMFETSTDNNWIISEFAKVVPYPFANSLSYEIYRNMPNDTDLTPFKKNGNKGFNFAYIQNRFDYHTGGDNIKNTSVESIQHHGSYAVSLIQHFAGIDLDNSEKGNAVYFNTIGKGFVHYSYNWNVPFMILTCLVLCVIFYIGFRKKLIRTLPTLFGFFAFIIHLVIAPLVVTLIYFILIKYYPGNEYRLLFYNQDTVLLGFAGISIAISFLFYKLTMKGIRLWHLIPFIFLFFTLLIWSGQISLLTALATIGVAALIWLMYRKPVNVWEISLGAFAGWAILMVVACFVMPGVSYLFTWPLLFSMIPVGIYFLRKHQNEYSFLQTGLFLIAALPALLWFSNISNLFLVAMGLKLSGGAILFTVLCLSLLIVHIDIITRTKPWLVPLIAFSAGLIFLFIGTVHLKYNERYKKQNSLILATNGNTNESFLTSFNDKPDEWTIEYLSQNPDTIKLEDFYLFGKRDVLVKPVMGENLPAPALIVLKDTIANKQRLLRLHINSERKADNLFIQIKTDLDSIQVGINHSGLKMLNGLKDSEWHLIRYYAFPEEGIDMELKIEENQNIEISLIDFIYGLPVLREINIKPRPDYMMSNGDMTIATKKFVVAHKKSI